MTTPYAPVAAPLPASINLIQDVADPVNAASINPLVVQLADAIARASQTAIYQISSPQTVATTDPFTLSALTEGPGIAYNAGDKTITIDDAGQYLFTLNSLVALDTTSTDFVAKLRLMGAVDLGYFFGSRWSADDSVPFAICGSFIVVVSAGANFSLVNDNAVDCTVGGTVEQRLCIARIN